VTSIIIFLGVLAAIALGGWIVSKITGSRAWFIETWPYDAGETIVWREDRADVVTVPKFGQAVSMRPIRAHRWSAVVTNRRVLLGNKTFTGKQMVKYVLWPGPAPDDHSKRADGGLFTVGYSTVVIAPGGLTVHDAYVALTPLASEPSSVNLSEIRIYTDSASDFRLP
jgi:hypothetical protein